MGNPARGTKITNFGQPAEHEFIPDACAEEVCTTFESSCRRKSSVPICYREGPSECIIFSYAVRAAFCRSAFDGIPVRDEYLAPHSRLKRSISVKATSRNLPRNDRPIPRIDARICDINFNA